MSYFAKTNHRYDPLGFQCLCRLSLVSTTVIAICTIKLHSEVFCIHLTLPKSIIIMPYLTLYLICLKSVIGPKGSKVLCGDLFCHNQQSVTTNKHGFAFYGFSQTEILLFFLPCTNIFLLQQFGQQNHLAKSQLNISKSDCVLPAAVLTKKKRDLSIK